MIPINAQEALDAVRQIIDDSDGTVWTDEQIVVNLKQAERKVKSERPSSAYTSPVAFGESATLTPTGTGDTVLADTDTIAVDEFYFDALVHFTAYLCFTSPTERSTVNKSFADRELALYKDAI